MAEQDKCKPSEKEGKRAKEKPPPSKTHNQKILGRHSPLMRKKKAPVSLATALWI